MRMRTVVLILFVLGIASASLAQGYDALVREAESKIMAQKWEEALALYEQAFKTGEFNYGDFYNAACASARLGKSDAAYSYLLKAIDAGFLEKDQLNQDPDLESLRSGDRWQTVTDALKQRLEAIEKTFPETRPAGPVIDLPAPRYDSPISVEAALKNRRSIRSYAEAPLALADVSQLLWAAYGITEPAENMPAFLRGGLRTAPSAGARYPLDLYLAAFNVTGLPAGIYWYNSEKHQLMRIVEGDRRKEVSEAAFNQGMFETASAAIVYSAVYERSMVKYGQRGRDRYVCMDLGHSAENVYLQAYALKIGTVAVGAFTDLWLKKAIGMTRAEEPLYIMPLGKIE
ncbi:MAG: SagB/ThcOx family dehydrogenase [Candidatus Krumholzibacteria bacterium]|nr:SagB/ThcOx family dehydrogenase [Candidatus Krumholzibacteria bacterium]